MARIKKEDRNFVFDNPITLNIKYYIKRIVYFFYAVLCHIALRLRRKKKSEGKKYQVSICAIFKNEAKYLKEWIEFHKIIGVEHFYLYNNNSDDNYLDVLKTYVEQGIVDLIEWPFAQGQISAYRHCVKNYEQETRWIGFIDIDEFVIPKAYNSIVDFLEQFEFKPAVLLYWRMFGTSGKVTRDERSLVTEDFILCWGKNTNIGKCFFNTSFRLLEDERKNGILHHFAWAKLGRLIIPPVNFENHFVFPTVNAVYTSDFPIVINHYFTKSFQEYAEKKRKGDVYYTINPHDEKYFYYHEMPCRMADYSAYRFLIRLKLKMDITQ